MEYYRIPLYIFFGILPSLVWLFYYLKKDLHPEPKKMIIRVFLLGSLVTIPVFLIQLSLSQLFGSFLQNSHPIILSAIKWFLVIALTEELFKYVVVKLGVFGSYALDEPLDIMLYMVVGALGFSAVENILYLFSPLDTTSVVALLQTTALVAFIRFIGATFLHTLCSGLVGYFMAFSWARNKSPVSFTVIGLVLATLLHGLYDFSIITLAMPFNLLIPLVILAGLVLFMLYDFNEIKKVKSICKI